MARPWFTQEAGRRVQAQLYDVIELIHQLRSAGAVNGDLDVLLRHALAAEAEARRLAGAAPPVGAVREARQPHQHRYVRP